ncbi:MAG: hypothetical protein HYV26_08350, partial [Candidatus Hydrogenedentes bacterium]|nr:hypothetical protein [Candidatus Hydrogenedentota bacterium]
ASQNMQDEDDFRLGVVNWGPNTPTEPDPDTWVGLAGEARNDFKKFQEFPWGSRGVGFITFFKEPPVHHFMDGNVAGQKADNSGFDWVRSHGSAKRRTGVIEARLSVVGPNSVQIDSASEAALPTQTVGQAFTLVIRGAGFGTKPTVVLSGYDVTVTGATDEAISISIMTREDAPPEEPIVLIVRNPDTGEEASRDDLFRLGSGTTDDSPEIASIVPDSATREDFPILINGRNFPEIEDLEVIFGRTLMPVQSVLADGTQIIVGFPAGGLPTTGRMDVTVRNVDKERQDILLNGFEFINPPQKQCVILGCAADAGAKGAGVWGDLAVLLFAAAGLAGGMVVSRRRRHA